MVPSYMIRVKLLAKQIYEFDSEVVEAFYEIVEECYNKEFPPRKTVEVIAEVVNGGLN